MSQVEGKRPKRRWKQYLLISVGILLTVVLAAAVVYFWEEMRDVESYGHYKGGFLF